MELFLCSYCDFWSQNTAACFASMEHTILSNALQAAKVTGIPEMADLPTSNSRPMKLSMSYSAQAVLELAFQQFFSFLLSPFFLGGSTFPRLEYLTIRVWGALILLKLMYIPVFILKGLTTLCILFQSFVSIRFLHLSHFPFPSACSTFHYSAPLGLYHWAQP